MERMKFHHAVKIHPIVGEIYGGLHEEESGACAVKQGFVKNAGLMANIMNKDPKSAMIQAEKENTVIELKIGDTYYTNNRLYTHGVDDGTHPI